MKIVKNRARGVEDTAPTASNIDDDRPPVQHRTISLIWSIFCQAVKYVGVWLLALWALFINSHLVEHKQQYKLKLVERWSHMIGDEKALDSGSGVWQPPLENIGPSDNFHNTPRSLPIEISTEPSLSKRREVPDNTYSRPTPQSETYFLPESDLSPPVPLVPPFPKQMVAVSSPPFPHVHSSINPAPLRHLRGDTKTDSTPSFEDTFPVKAARKSEVQTTNEEFCRSLRQEKGVIPGKSWGAMSKKEQSEWMTRRCDRYFCAPNKMEGRGVYSCKPL
jgi:hypothetical protein